MFVQVKVDLSVPATAVHREAMRMGALSRTNDKNSVQIFIPEGSNMEVIAVFTIKKARQTDVVDHIGEAFWMVDDYSRSSIQFPKKTPSWYQVNKPLFTPKQGQYLAFIYYYTKINGRAPAHIDMQRYFQTTPASVHNMVLTLEKKGLISRVPHQPRSIKLLVTQAEIPDLD